MAHEILFIESTEADRRDIGQFLESIGFKIHFATGSKDGLRLFNDIRPDLVIVEVLISGNMNGLQVCQAIKSQAPEWAKVIVLSKLYQSRAMAKDAIRKYKADAYLEKPFSTNKLYNTISKLVKVPPIPASESKTGIREVPKENRKTMPGEKAPAPPEQVPEPTQAPAQPDQVPVPSQAAPAPPAQSKPKPTSEAPPPSPEPDLGQATEEALQVEPEYDKGEVTRENLSPLLIFCFREKVNGVLILEYPEGVKHIFLVDGTPVFVQSNIRSESLGQILIQEKHLTKEQYQLVLEDSTVKSFLKPHHA